MSSFDKYRAYDIQGNRRPTPCIFIVLATPPKIVRIHTLLGHNGGVEGFDDLISWEETLAGKLGWEVARDVNEIERTGKNLPVSCWAPLALFFFLPISIIWEVESRSNQDCASARLKRCSRMNCNSLIEAEEQSSKTCRLFSNERGRYFRWKDHVTVGSCIAVWWWSWHEGVVEHGIWSHELIDTKAASWRQLDVIWWDDS